MKRRNFLASLLALPFMSKVVVSEPLKRTKGLKPFGRRHMTVSTHSTIIVDVECYDGPISLGDPVYVRSDGRVAPAYGGDLHHVIGQVVQLRRDFYNVGRVNQGSLVKAAIRLL